MAKSEFVDSRPLKNVSDWNDLVQVKGVEFAKDQMVEKLRAYL